MLFDVLWGGWIFDLYALCRYELENLHGIFAKTCSILFEFHLYDLWAGDISVID